MTVSSAPPPAGLGPFFDISQELLCVVGLDGHVRAANRAWEGALGYTPEDLVGRPFLDFLHPDDLDGVAEALGRIRAGLPTRDLECRVRANDGSWRRLLWSSNHRVQGDLLFAVGRDVTEHRRREEELRESEAGFGLLAEAVQRHLLTIREQAAMLDVAQEAILVRELSGEILFWNRAAEQLYGWTFDEAVGKVAQSLLGARFTVPLDGLVAELLAQGRWEGELIHRRRDGTRLTVASRWALHRREGEQEPVVLESNTDVTERRRAETALRESEERFRAVFESAAIGMALTDMAGRLVEANAALAGLLGFELSELRGRSFAELAHPDDVSADLALFEDVAEGRRPSYRVDKRLLRREGSVVPARVTVSVVRDSDGDPLFAVAMVEDMRLALVDELTGLNNRRAFLAFGQQQLALAVREHRTPAVLFMDLDGMKVINDTHGHSEGDRALLDLAGILGRTFRASDFCARYGGDEFCVLLPEGSQVETAVERFQLEVLRWNGLCRRPYALSVSVGWARFDWREPCSTEELIARADRDMYRAKNRATA